MSFDAASLTSSLPNPIDWVKVKVRCGLLVCKRPNRGFGTITRMNRPD